MLPPAYRIAAVALLLTAMDSWISALQIQLFLCFLLAMDAIARLASARLPCCLEEAVRSRLQYHLETGHGGLGTKMGQHYATRPPGAAKHS